MKKLIFILALAVTIAVAYAVVEVDEVVQKTPTFEDAIAIIKEYEGLSGRCHWPFVGYGHKVMPGEKFTRGKVLSEMEADLLARKDYTKLCALYRDFFQSLKAEYRGNWIPVATLLETEGNGIYRIDMKGNTCRLMGFDTPEGAGSDPMLLLVGSMHTEGSVETKVYTFGGNSGMTAEYIPDSESPMRLMLKKPNEKEEEIPVMPAYWRDYVKTGHAYLEK